VAKKIEKPKAKEEPKITNKFGNPPPVLPDEKIAKPR